MYKTNHKKGDIILYMAMKILNLKYFGNHDFDL